MAARRGKREGEAPRFRWGETQSLLVVVFVCGAVVMAFEMVGSRILAPQFGTTVFIWGSLIGIVLGALSLGYFVGGRVADKWPSFFLLGGIIAVAGLIVLIVPLYAPACNQWISKSAPERSSNPLFASVLLFFVPAVLLGMVSPFAVRLQARSVATVGNVAGRLYALSTLGSIAGTLLATFWMIPSFGTSNLTRGLGITLIVVSMLAIVPWVMRRARTGRVVGAGVGLMGAFVLCTVPSPSFIPLGDGEKLVAEVDSPYQHIGVVLIPYGRDENQEWTVRMVFDEYIESEVYVEFPGAAKYDTEVRGVWLDPTFPYVHWRRRRLVSADDFEVRLPYESAAKYTDMLHLPFLFNPDAKRALIVGGGGGVVPTIFRNDYPELETTVVELDPHVVRVAERYFGFEPQGERTRTIIQDGRVYMRDCTEHYDIIILDAFTGGRPPFHLLTREFLQLVKARLTERGVVHLNIISALHDTHEKGRLYRSMHNTFREVFGRDRVYVFPKWYDPRWGHNRATTYGINVELLATNFPTIPNPLPKDKLVAVADELVRTDKIKIASIPIHARNYQPAERDKDFPNDPPLTDDFAPVDVMVTD